MQRPGESKQHNQQKERIGNAAKEKGWNIQVDTKEFKIPGQKHPYIADVYGENFSSCDFIKCGPQLLRIADNNGEIHRRLLGNGGRLKGIPEYARGMRRFIAELQGFKAHNTRLAYQNDIIRIGQIREYHGDIEYYEFYLKNKRSPNDIRNYSIQDIQEHLRL